MSVSKDWYKNFFDKFYSNVILNNYDNYNDKTDMLNVIKNKKVLDSCCGNGVVSNILMQNNNIVEGLDINKHSIKKLNSNYKSIIEKTKSNFFVDDVLNFKKSNYYDVVINWNTSFGYMNKEDNNKIIENISNSLKKKGLFYIDIPNKNYILSKNLKTFEHLINDNEKIVRYNELIEGKIVKQKWEYYKDKNLIWEKEGTLLYLYSKKEIINLLEKNGFKINRLYGNYLCEEYNENSKRIIIISQKL